MATVRRRTYHLDTCPRAENVNNFSATYPKSGAPLQSYIGAGCFPVALAIEHAALPSRAVCHWWPPPYEAARSSLHLLSGLTTTSPAPLTTRCGCGISRRRDPAH